MQLCWPEDLNSATNGNLSLKPQNVGISRFTSIITELQHFVEEHLEK